MQFLRIDQRLIIVVFLHWYIHLIWKFSSHHSFCLFMWNVDLPSQIFILYNTYCSYLPSPSSSITAYFDELTYIFESITYDNTIILDDFNIQYNSSNTPASSLKWLIYELSLTQHIHFPTNTNGNCIDLVISPSSSKLVSSTFQSFLIFDHFAIKFELLLPTFAIPRPVSSFRKIYAINITSFVRSVCSQLDIHQCHILPDSLFDNFNSAVSNSLELFAPITESPNRSYSKSHWYSNELVNLRRSLRWLQTQYQSTNLDADLKAFKVSRSIYRCKLLTYKSSYFTGKFNNFGMTSKQVFKLSFKLIGRYLNRHLPDQPAYFLCTAFSSFFQWKISLIID